MDLKKKININEMFGPTLQGEGMLAGVPCYFIRTNGCNLRCEWKNKDGTTTKCDTPYTSWAAEPAKMMSIEEIMTWVTEKKNLTPEVKNMIISGGEPFLNPGLEDLVKCLTDSGWHVSIETNGTIFKETTASLISVSPKLKSSLPIDPDSFEHKLHSKNRVYNVTLPKFIEFYGDKMQFKFVYNSIEDVKEIQEEFMYPYNIKPQQIWLMPQGITQEQIKEKSKELFNLCSEKGFRYGQRLHIEVFGDVRGI